jgi:hypothetical protein
MADGDSLTLRYDVAIADGDLAAPACGALAGLMGASDVLGAARDL